LLKALLKQNDKEFSEEWLDCIASIVAEYPSTFIQWQGMQNDILQIGLKQMELRGTHTILFNFFCSRLTEAKQ